MRAVNRPHYDLLTAFPFRDISAIRVTIGHYQWSARWDVLLRLSLRRSPYSNSLVFPLFSRDCCIASLRPRSQAHVPVPAL